MFTKTRKIADLTKASTVKTKGKIYIAVLEGRQPAPQAHQSLRPTCGRDHTYLTTVI